MPISILLLLAVALGALIAAGVAMQLDRARRAVLDRAAGQGSSSLLVLQQPQQSTGARIADWLGAHLPAAWTNKEAVNNTLLQAGFEHPGAAAVYATARAATAVLLPAVTYAFAPRSNALFFISTILIGAAVGLLLPSSVLSRLAQRRQLRVRRSLPDSMDLLVVCVEAGISLDAALLRVAKEMTILHPDLSHELLVVNRRVNAGMPREQALHALWLRTGVEELRSLASNLIQAERWGTSVGTVLRVYAEGLRRKRKQAAEKKAATAPLKMMIPLATCIFPTLFVVLLGPAIIAIMAMFRNIER